ncbi:hypothetical protein NX059_007592 [Plenodomus lindquistii]|nr:hypothetical protein NX059_007592 [Plenodomus lindquistii]
MPLELHVCTEADMADFARIQEAAFDSLGHGMIELLTPNPKPADYMEKSINKNIKQFREEKDLTFLKVIDTDLDGKMIAVAKWRINHHERTEEQIQSMFPTPGPEDEGRLGALDFMKFLRRVREGYMGTKPYYRESCSVGTFWHEANIGKVLHILGTDPAHHRRGAGGMLLQWGVERADRDNLPAFLEASLMARPLYAKFGFTPREEVVWDLTKYGLSGTDMSTVMIRDPQPYVS